MVHDFANASAEGPSSDAYREKFVKPWDAAATGRTIKGLHGIAVIACHHPTIHQTLSLLLNTLTLSDNHRQNLQERELSDKQVDLCS